MKVVTWNVNSLNAREEFVGLYLDAESPDVLCIQELKLADDKVPVELFESRGYHVALFGQPKWNGVLIASREPLENVHRGLADGDEGQSRLIAATTGGIRFVNLYCPQGQAEDSPKFPYKLGFYKALREWLQAEHSREDPLIVLGDLNIAPDPEDIWDPAGHANVPSFHPLEHDEWRQLVSGSGLHDAVKPHIEPNTYSYWDYRGGCFHRKQGMRIDHILVTECLLPRIESGWIQRDWRKKKSGLTPSDHCPVGITLTPG